MAQIPFAQIPHAQNNVRKSHMRKFRYAYAFMIGAIMRVVYTRDVTVYTRNSSISCIVYRVSCIHVHTRNFINTRKYIHEIFALTNF